MNCIKREDGTAWCGAELDNSFHFKDIDQAIINNQHGSRIVCPYCLLSLIAVLIVTPPNAVLTTEAQ